MPNFQVRFEQRHVWHIFIYVSHPDDAPAAAALLMFQQKLEPLIYTDFQTYDENGNDIDWDTYDRKEDAT